MQSLVKLENVKKLYDLDQVRVNAINGVSFEIKYGDFVAIIGPSGSGKSTLLNLIGSLDLPSSGRVLINNVDIRGLHKDMIAELRGKEIGFVFQTFNLISSLSALENVMLPMIFQNKSRLERIEKGRKLLTKVGLSDRMNHLPSELSGGERQRVAIARALVNDPKIILADEPTGNLDSKTGEDIICILKDLNQKGSTVIVITHDLSIAKKADRIIKIKDGLVEK